MIREDRPKELPIVRLLAGIRNMGYTLHLHCEVWRFGAERARGSKVADKGDTGECGMAAGG